MKSISEYAKSRSIYRLYWITSFRHSAFVFLYSGFCIMYVLCVSRRPKSLCNSACSRPKSRDEIKSVDEFTPHTCLKKNRKNSVMIEICTIAIVFCMKMVSYIGLYSFWIILQLLLEPTSVQLLFR